MLQLTLIITKLPHIGYTGWIQNVKGVIAQGDTIEEVKKELLLSLNVKIAYALGVPLSAMEEKKDGYKLTVFTQDLPELDNSLKQMFSFIGQPILNPQSNDAVRHIND